MVVCDRCHRKLSSYAALKQHYFDRHSNVRWPGEYEKALTAERESESYRSTMHPNRPSHNKLWMGVVLISITILGSAVWYFSSYSSGQSSAATELLSGSPSILGASTALVTIVEFGDFQCPSCGQWFGVVEPQILQNLVQSGKAKFEWRDFDYFGPDSTYASEAAYAAGEQGKFWQMYDTLYSNQQTANNGWADKGNLAKFAQGLGLNMTQFNNDVESGKYLNRIKANYDLGRSLGVNATPTFILLGPNGKIIMIVGPQPYSAFENAVNALIGG